MFDLTSLPHLVLWGIRLVAGLLCGLLAYLSSGPLVRLLYRLAWAQAAPAAVVFVGRGASGLLAGVLVFLYLPLGGGLGWGWGPGDGGGPGAGPGPGGPAASARPPATTPSPPLGKKDTKETSPAAPVLTISIVPSSAYPGEGRYYLVDDRLPARTLQEVEQLLHSRPWQRLRILIYANSAYSRSDLGDHPAITALKQKAEEAHIPWECPPEYRQKLRSLPAAENLP
jgi:hypothetical protein